MTARDFRCAGARRVGLALGAATLLCLAAPAGAQLSDTDRARRIHDRIAGVPPSAETLSAMVADLGGGNVMQAASRAIGHPDFYRVTLKNLVTPWTNEEMTAFAPLNDYTATVIGMVRDDEDFRQILSGDILYVGGSGLPAYTRDSNELYEELEREADPATGKPYDLGDPNVLVRRSQSGVTGLPAQATAGVMTTRAAARAFFSAGTNRAMLRFTVLNHLCRDLEQMKDGSLPPDRIRQDVSRSPGGDSRIFLNNCVGCHAGMDPVAQAFAFYEFEYAGDIDSGRIVYTDRQVQPKYLINDQNFAPGYITTDDGWDNYWRRGVNASLGWGPGSGSGAGAKSLGQELAHSQAFAQCQVRKVFRAVCLREPASDTDRTAFQSMVSAFKSGTAQWQGPYNLKNPFAQAAAHCTQP